jgi:hypothetical protein
VVSFRLFQLARRDFLFYVNPDLPLQFAALVISMWRCKKASETSGRATSRMRLRCSVYRAMNTPNTFRARECVFNCAREKVRSARTEGAMRTFEFKYLAVKTRRMKDKLQGVARLASFSRPLYTLIYSFIYSLTSTGYRHFLDENHCSETFRRVLRRYNGKSLADRGD